MMVFTSNDAEVLRERKAAAAAPWIDFLLRNNKNLRTVDLSSFTECCCRRCLRNLSLHVGGSLASMRKVQKTEKDQFLSRHEFSRKWSDSKTYQRKEIAGEIKASEYVMHQQELRQKRRTTAALSTARLARH